MRYLRALLVCAVAGVVATPVASAHVTFNPSEWEAGGFARFVIRVPTERDNAATTRVTVQLPENVISARFQPVPGWKRTIEMAPLAEPIEEEGEEPITERLASVTWSGGRIEPDEFQEFGISFQVPEDAAGEDLLFPTLQAYSGGEVVRWISDDPEADEPAPRVTVLEAADEEATPAATTTEESASPDAAAAATTDDSDDDGRANLALAFGIAGLLAGLAALAVAIFRGPRTA